MSVTEETLRLNWEQKGEAVIDEANARLRETEAELQKLRILYGLGSVAEDDYAASTAKLAQQKRELKQELAAYNQMAQPATDRTRNLGRGFLELSRAFEDAQYGLHGVLNNIPGAIQMFGGPAGLAAAVSGVAVTISILLPRLKAVYTELYGVDQAAEMLKGTIGQLQERVEELSKKPLKLAVDSFELDLARKKLEELKAAEAAWKAAHETRNSAERESGQATAETLAETEGGEGAAVDRLRAAMIRKGQEQSLTLKEAADEINEAQARMEEAQARAKAFLAGGDTDSAAIAEQQAGQQQARIEEARRRDSAAREKIRKDAEDSIGAMLKGAKEGDARQQQALIRAFLDAGMRQLAQDLHSASVRVLEAYDKEVADFERGLQARHDAVARRDARASRAKKADDEWDKGMEEQGREIDVQDTRDVREAVARGTKEGHALDAEAKTNEHAIDAEVKKIRDTLGKQLQGAFEQAMAQNAELAASGAPVARSRAEERRLRRNGQAYALPPEELERRNRAQMAALFRRRGAGEQAANLAARQIQGAGNEDLQRRAARLGGGTLSLAQQQLALTGELTQAYGRMDGTLRALMQEQERQQRELRNVRRPAGRRVN